MEIYSYISTPSFLLYNIGDLSMKYIYNFFNSVVNTIKKIINHRNNKIINTNSDNNNNLSINNNISTTYYNDNFNRQDNNIYCNGITKDISTLIILGLK
jgi:hypothetical protein